MKATEGNNTGYIFEASGSAQADDDGPGTYIITYSLMMLDADGVIGVRLQFVDLRFDITGSPVIIDIAWLIAYLTTYGVFGFFYHVRAGGKFVAPHLKVLSACYLP